MRFAGMVPPLKLHHWPQPMLRQIPIQLLRLAPPLAIGYRHIIPLLELKAEGWRLKQQYMMFHQCREQQTEEVVVQAQLN